MFPFVWITIFNDKELSIWPLNIAIENNYHTCNPFIKVYYFSSLVMISSFQKTLLFNSSISRIPSLPKWIFEWNDKIRKLCRIYLKECAELRLENKKIWKIKASISCYIRNVIYYTSINFVCMKHLLKNLLVIIFMV